MKLFTVSSLVPMLAFTLFVCGCANQPAQNQSAQQAAAAMPTPTPPLQSYRPMAGGMGRGY